MYDTQEVDLLPLFAIYRSYFDIFYPQRDVEYEATSAHKLLQWCVENNKNLTDLTVNTSVSTFGLSTFVTNSVNVHVPTVLYY